MKSRFYCFENLFLHKIYFGFSSYIIKIIKIQVYRYKLKYIVFFLSAFIAFGCSTKKNTAVRRGYHNLTSRYNILYNGKESFKKGMQKLESGFKDDFSELLPVFLYSSKEATATIDPEMDRAMKKATKMLTMHSITVKPELKSKGELSQKEREFYNKKEYNKWADDAYLLLGKAQFYKQTYDPAQETFNYIVQSFPESNSVFEAKLWLARIADEKEKYRDAEDYLSDLTKNISLPHELIGEISATWTDFYIKQGKFKDAIPFLLKAISYTRHKYTRTRYTFLMAQLYAKTGDNVQASEYYDKVVNMNPHYEMAFNAKINRALTYQTGASSRKDIEKELKKMLRDDKNNDYRDQIYYAIGQLYFKDKNFDEAIKYFKLSLESGKDNNRQRAKTQITLADWYYAIPDYVNAQVYYDSAVGLIDEHYPDYQTLLTKSISLTNLVKNLNAYQFNDSVLKLAALSSEELNNLVDELIEKEKKDEEEKALKIQEDEQQRLDMNDALAQQVNTTTPGSNNWYFYNPTIKTLGHKDFVKNWGNRKLEDNWRRKNKNSTSFDALASETSGEKSDAKTEKTKAKTKVTNKLSRDYYLQDIPFTDSAKIEANKKIANGLYNVGMIYGDELKDYQKSINTFEELLKRYPNYENRLQVYFKIYSLAKINADLNRESIYQDKIVKEFPNSNYAKLITNPNYISEMQAVEKQISENYSQTLQLYQQGNYDQVEVRSLQAMKDYPSDKLFPNYKYLFTVTSGLKKDTISFITDLQKFEAKYPKTELAASAQIIIEYLQNKHPEIIEKQNEIVAHELFSASMNEMHYFIYSVPDQTNMNQLIFNIINFNLDNFDTLKLEVKKLNIGKDFYCQVGQFKNGDESMVYLRKIITSDEIFHDLNRQNLLPFVISQSNLKAMTESGKDQQYLIFYKENYK